jgi:hypothetical protein
MLLVMFEYNRNVRKNVKTTVVSPVLKKPIGDTLNFQQDVLKKNMLSKDY